MEKIKIKFEYQCFPIWLYDNNNNLIDNELPSNLVGDAVIDTLFVNLQEVFDSLFINDGIEFKYVGFIQENLKHEFIQQLDNAIIILKERIGNRYIIENCLNLQDL
jgi:hypothetical protein